MFTCHRANPSVLQMMSDHGGLTPNLVSSQTDDYWRAVRKAVSPAFAYSHLK